MSGFYFLYTEISSSSALSSDCLSYAFHPTPPSSFFTAGGCCMSHSPPILCYSHQQQGWQMSMAIGFFPSHRPSPYPTQWVRLSMQHAQAYAETHSHTQRGLYSGAEYRFPTICSVSAGMLLSSFAVERAEHEVKEEGKRD